MEERYSVATPENISFSYDVAGIGSRFLAALIDLAVYLLLTITLAILYTQTQRFITDSIVQSYLDALYVGVTFVLYWAYYIFFELIWAGQSPGKRLIRIRVVRLDGTPAAPSQIIIRNIGRLVDMFPGFYAVGFIVMFSNERSRRLGDFAAGTLVVRETARLSLKQLNETSANRYHLNDRARAEAEALPINRLSKEQRLLIRDYMARRTKMSDAQRARFALQIGASAAREMDITVPTHPSQADYLLELMTGVMEQ